MIDVTVRDLIQDALNKLDIRGRPDDFTPHETASLALFSAVAGVVLRNSALYEFLLESGQQANAVFEGVLGSAPDMRRRRSSISQPQVALPSHSSTRLAWSTG